MVGGRVQQTTALMILCADDCSSLSSGCRILNVAVFDGHGEWNLFYLDSAACGSQGPLHVGVRDRQMFKAIQIRHREADGNMRIQPPDRNRASPQA